MNPQASALDHSVAGSSPTASSLPDSPPAGPAPSTPPLRFHFDPRYVPNDYPVTLASLPHNLLQDQLDIWTSPARLRWQDARWFVPLAVGTGLLIGSDHHSATALIHPTASTVTRSSDVANGGLALLGGLPALMLLNSTINSSPHGRETAYLSGEAVADSLVVNEAFKFAFNRDRPGVDDSSGRFFQGNNLSFPSNHAIAAWSLASVLGQEYPGAWSRLGVYSAATAVSLARVAGEQHFPSDVLVGSAFGYLIGHYVYRARHNDAMTGDFQSADPAPGGPDAPEHLVAYTPGASLQQSAQALAAEPPLPVYHPSAADVDPDARGSVYVPMDSWIYPALDRLAALGFVPSQNAGIRPWTREECLRQLAEAEAQVGFLLDDHDASRWEQSAAAEGQRLIAALKTEFANENDAYEYIQLDSIYARGTTIAGRPLTRSFDLGQTLGNDYGRPFTEGTNAISGAAISAVSGRFSFYVRDEFQHAPGAPNFSPTTLAFLNPGLGVQLPPPLGVSFADIARNRPLEMHTGVELGGFEFQFGKQELYWGPTYDAPLSWSVNAEPTYNFQIVSTRPHQLPGFLDTLGTYRFDFVLGKMSGHTSPARPWYNGQKVTFNLGNNLELGFTRWSLFAGVGTPLTLSTFLHNIFSFSSDTTGTDPGDRKAGFDFRYHVPGARWITLYSDSYADDEPSPLDSPRRSAWDPGIYLSRIPGLPRVDLRFEVASTELFSSDHGPIFLYTNDHYVDANLNKGFFVGNSVGRDGRRYEGWTTYWLTGRDNIQLGYRQTQRSDQLLPGAATQSDALLRSTFALGHHVTANLFAQYERYNEPILTPGPQRNITGQFELKWEPKTRAAR
jgi:membrane-associated phospholipid phosphatase